MPDSLPLPFFHPRPLCSECHRHSARPNHRRCTRCAANNRRKSTQAEARARRAVLSFLGGHCSCHGTPCWHGGPCPVDCWDALTVDHQHQNGRLDRPRTRSGRITTRRMWQNYHRRLRTPNHGLRILCASCHHVVTRRTLRTKNTPISPTTPPSPPSR